ASRAPIDRLLAYRDRMGWEIDWVSNESEFNTDMGFVIPEQDLRPWLDSGDIPATVTQNAEMCGTDALGYVTERPGLDVFALADGKVHRTYTVSNRGLEVPGMAYYALLDRTPKGRDESATEPLWIRRHDEY